MQKDSESQAQAFKLLSIYMTALLGNDKHLCKALIPSFAVGCRRLTPGPGYLESLTKENVRVVTENIARIVPTGIEIATGDVAEVDSLICATGFDLSFRPRFSVIGRKGNLQDLWTENLPRAYMSCVVHDSPIISVSPLITRDKENDVTNVFVKCSSAPTAPSATAVKASGY